ncbi:MAG: 2-succinyl-5-enolpyruvyl-6-hydroxy-3-cyclohexene-1-carboxylic-acid synthase [Acidimicrobiales bacterium]|nr:2-succinyl-5-enolpyruvyl-6-hydroxy-3-cyclohexene-1-carboxylic-acid synthase [Acidimicrobiales bacterium]MDP6298010.1 2-succinyl-5-enolpyruvyl-6-hydroxy-3-cyclohexene-1-carboxylic-acid synthase [Acidimicrobiales bacterium]HJM28463.1 2-succinyl-5-enolpyruvyl-6-hydroxy-3-cyclohexene-1-carboxylic-acid synthase [Acidimicrobiales bacterium]HJM96962.1 2-succinyl-5-enolpyruvyl-6-hydroxy-3-cyclohexene-1-carboxylic-acid synthase [Acidimicrobiales bacterium]
MNTKSSNDKEKSSPYPLCLRFFAEIKALGVKEVIISPGSRSTPLVLSAHAVGLEIRVVLDERVASFYALGNAKSSGVPCILICTSGTSSANYLPAVVEANHAGVPMIVCSADRPPEQRQWGAGQTIDQVNLYGRNVRWGFDLPVATEVDEMFARSIAVRAWERAQVGQGPVHLNWPFREPLEPDGELSKPIATLKPFEISNAVPSGRKRLEELAVQYERGLVVVGPNDFTNVELQQILFFSQFAGWPILADPASQMRGGSMGQQHNVITTAEILCGSEHFTQSLKGVEAIVHTGLTPTSKEYRKWAAKNPPLKKILVSPGTDWSDPSNQLVEAHQGNLFCGFEDSEKQIRPDSDWLMKWREADSKATSIISESMSAAKSGISAIQAVRLGVPDGATIVLSNSMTIRNAELAFMNKGNAYRTISNRGANGIDGVVSTSVGVAFGADGKTLAVVGDVAATHDIGGFFAADRLQTDLTIVIFDNKGGGIFSSLPVAQSVDKEIFNKFYTTSPNLALPEILAAAGITVEIPTSLDGLTAAVTSGIAGEGLTVIWYRTDSTTTVENINQIRENFDIEFVG